MAKLAIGILAAGSSKRLGQPKQLLSVGGVCLLQRQVNVASATGWPVTVVLADQGETERMREQLNVPTLVNELHASGMASTIKCLVEAVPADAWLFITVDQYRLDTQHLTTMIDHWQASNLTSTIVASAYDSILGIPALIPMHYKEALLNLEGDQGAGRIIRYVQKQSPNSIIAIENQALSFDVDTTEDLAILNNYFKNS